MAEIRLRVTVLFIKDLFYHHQYSFVCLRCRTYCESRIFIN